MADKQLDQDVKAVVEDILKQKEESEMLKETEEALNKSAEKINELVTSLEAKDVELSAFTTKVGELEVTAKDLADKNTELQKNLDETKTGFEAEKAELLKRAEAAETELKNIQKNQIAAARFEELKNDGVAATEPKAIEDQTSKIREMADEEFAAYKAERVELRKTILAEIEKQAPPADAKNDTTEDAAKKAAEEEAAKKAAADKAVADEVEIANSKDSINPMNAIASMLNMEVVPGNEIVNKYKELGQAMAEKFKNRKVRGNK